MISSVTRPPEEYLTTPGWEFCYYRNEYDRNVYGECSYIGNRTGIRCKQVRSKEVLDNNNGQCELHKEFRGEISRRWNREQIRLNAEDGRKGRKRFRKVLRLNELMVDEEKSLEPCEKFRRTIVDDCNSFAPEVISKDVPLWNAGVFTEKDLIRTRIELLKRQISSLEEAREMNEERFRRNYSDEMEKKIKSIDLEGMNAAVHRMNMTFHGDNRHLRILEGFSDRKQKEGKTNETEDEGRCEHALVEVVVEDVVESLLSTLEKEEKEDEEEEDRWVIDIPEDEKDKEKEHEKPSWRTATRCAQRAVPLGSFCWEHMKESKLKLQWSHCEGEAGCRLLAVFEQGSKKLCAKHELEARKELAAEQERLAEAQLQSVFLKESQSMSNKYGTLDVSSAEMVARVIEETKKASAAAQYSRAQQGKRNQGGRSHPNALPSPGVASLDMISTKLNPAQLSAEALSCLNRGRQRKMKDDESRSCARCRPFLPAQHRRTRHMTKEQILKILPDSSRYATIPYANPPMKKYAGGRITSPSMVVGSRPPSSHVPPGISTLGGGRQQMGVAHAPAGISPMSSARQGMSGSGAHPPAGVSPMSGGWQGMGGSGSHLSAGITSMSSGRPTVSSSNVYRTSTTTGQWSAQTRPPPPPPGQPRPPPPPSGQPRPPPPPSGQPRPPPPPSGQPRPPPPPSGQPRPPPPPSGQPRPPPPPSCQPRPPPPPPTSIPLPPHRMQSQNMGSSVAQYGDRQGQGSMEVSSRPAPPGPLPPPPPPPFLGSLRKEIDEDDYRLTDDIEMLEEDRRTPSPPPYRFPGSVRGNVSNRKSRGGARYISASDMRGGRTGVPASSNNRGGPPPASSSPIPPPFRSSNSFTAKPPLATPPPPPLSVPPGQRRSYQPPHQPPFSSSNALAPAPPFVPPQKCGLQQPGSSRVKVREEEDDSSPTVVFSSFDNQRKTNTERRPSVTDNSRKKIGGGWSEASKVNAGKTLPPTDEKISPAKRLSRDFSSSFESSQKQPETSSKSRVSPLDSTETSGMDPLSVLAAVSESARAAQQEEQVEDEEEYEEEL